MKRRVRVNGWTASDTNRGFSQSGQDEYFPEKSPERVIAAAAMEGYGRKLTRLLVYSQPLARSTAEYWRRY
ncbi:hypothetical protein A2U01_0052967 [Trifolium medium]|uniref:Uncharacterized protein n=1 Tax=Trifolium medium TaxID=97028 RepID=A0A392R873_9FABA|nr:hypothetical protein [Trifolium medium]